MRGFELVKKLPRGPFVSFLHILQALMDTFLRIGAGGDVEQALISCSILYDGRRFPLHCKHHGALAFFNCFIKSPDRRRKVVSDWMSLVMSSMGLLI